MANQTPPFLPGFSRYKKNTIPFSTKTVLRREYSGVLATVLGFTFIDDLRRYFTTDSFELQTIWHYALLVTTVLALILRSLKHYTKVLNEKDRG